MTMPRNLFLVRHGESEGNVAQQKAKNGDLSSFTDEFVTTPGRKWRLTEKGEEQARMAGAWLQNELTRIEPTQVHRHYVSPYIRTRQTAGHLWLTENDKSVDWYLNRTIRERDWGDIDSISKDEFRNNPIYRLNCQKESQDPLYWRPPGGESIQDVADNRVRNFLDTLHREMGRQTVVAVTHGEFMRAARTVLERISDETYDEWENSPAEKIHNCQILQYSAFRSTVDAGVQGRLRYMRKIYPIVEENRMSVGEWKEISFERPTNEDLLKV